MSEGVVPADAEIHLVLMHSDTPRLRESVTDENIVILAECALSSSSPRRRGSIFFFFFFFCSS